ncbi:hypothetical protein ACFQMA_04110 [Halosimplex aquaticum]|uniref:Uncharacterized protein n=1 Tax=Halosimplex aquaticum TaxID=3026162 RepID=A0ABD5XWQ8_9EURY|nr:hypothetical protein [Halosimplex aquaticum]
MTAPPSVARDALLAVVCGVALLTLLAVTESLSLLVRPGSAAAGIAAALAVEALFVADTPAGDLWERPAVQAGSVVALAAGGVVAVAVGGRWFVAAACWGVATYFVLLALVLTGVWNPTAS